MIRNTHIIEDTLITVRQENEYHLDSPLVILPDQLLHHNYNDMKNHYFIHDLQNYASKFSGQEQIYILGHEVTENFPNHTHDFFELTYVCKGDLINVIDGNELYMHQGDFTFMNDTAIQSLQCINPETLIVNFCIKRLLLEKIVSGFLPEKNLISRLLEHTDAEGPNYLYFSEIYNTDISLFVNRMIQEYTEAGFHQTYPLEGWLILLFNALSNSKHYSYIGIDKKALEILRYIQQHCINCTLKEIASDLGYNANYLTGYIKKHTGRNYTEIEKEVKLKEAARLLVQTELSTYEIAEACGYNSPSYFFKLFKQNYGISPQKYRKQF